MSTLPPFQPGLVINGRYRIERPLGEGGMGAVYRATDLELDRPVALKVPFLKAQDDQVLARFKREARIAASLVHPNICAVHDFGVIEEQPYLVMQLIEGVPLAQRTGPESLWQAKEAVELVHTLAQTMALVHQKGPLHRDLKPSNVMLCLHGPVIMDFGLARNLTETTQLTRTGFFPGGSPGYMSLEQFRGDTAHIGPAADVYSLGVILYELLTGVRPLTASCLPELCMKLINEQPLPPSARRPGLDPRLDAICLKALARDPQDRYPTMTALATDLKDWLNIMQSTDSLSFPTLPAFTKTVPATQTQPVMVAPSPQRESQWLALTVGLTALLLLGVAAWWGMEHLGFDLKAALPKQAATLVQTTAKADVVPPPEPARPADLPKAAPVKVVEEVPPPTPRPAIVPVNMPPVPPPVENEPELIVAPREVERPPALPPKKVAPPPLQAPFTAAEAQQRQAAWARFLDMPSTQTSPTGIKLVLVPPGEFQMGTPGDGHGGGKDELPHRVYLSRPFLVGATEVTQADYRRVMHRNPSNFPGDKNPVENLTWFDAVTFCNCLSEEEGLPVCYRITKVKQEKDGRITAADVTPVSDALGYRLLTEAEWEYACRAGTTTAFCLGEKLPHDQANCTEARHNRTRPVASYTANAFGLYDLHGNVWEWCADWYGDYRGDGVDPRGPETGTTRVYRGGCWSFPANNARSAFRGRSTPNVRFINLGFRLARGPFEEGKPKAGVFLTP